MYVHCAELIRPHCSVMVARDFQQTAIIIHEFVLYPQQYCQTIAPFPYADTGVQGSDQQSFRRMLAIIVWADVDR